MHGQYNLFIYVSALSLLQIDGSKANKENVILMCARMHCYVPCF